MQIYPLATENSVEDKDNIDNINNQFDNIKRLIPHNPTNKTSLIYDKIIT